MHEQALFTEESKYNLWEVGQVPPSPPPGRLLLVCTELASLAGLTCGKPSVYLSSASPLLCLAYFSQLGTESISCRPKSVLGLFCLPMFYLQLDFSKEQLCFFLLEALLTYCPFLREQRDLYVRWLGFCSLQFQIYKQSIRKGRTKCQAWDSTGRSRGGSFLNLKLWVEKETSKEGLCYLIKIIYDKEWDHSHGLGEYTTVC